MSKASQFQSVIEKSENSDLVSLGITTHATPYQVLGINPQSTPAETKKAYKIKLLKFHPDKNQGKAREMPLPKLSFLPTIFYQIAIKNMLMTILVILLPNRALRHLLLVHLNQLKAFSPQHNLLKCGNRL